MVTASARRPGPRAGPAGAAEALLHRVRHARDDQGRAVDGHVRCALSSIVMPWLSKNAPTAGAEVVFMVAVDAE
jgi:hypothetical protein